MKKNYFKRFISMFCAIMMFGTLLGTQAFAKDVDLEYATVKQMWFYQSFENKAKVGTVNLIEDARTHRIIFDAWFSPTSTDRGTGNIQLTVIAYNTNGVEIYRGSKVYQNANGGQCEFQDEFPVSMKDQITIWVDASTAPGETSNGNYRSAFLMDFSVYTD